MTRKEIIDRSIKPSTLSLLLAELSHLAGGPDFDITEAMPSIAEVMNLVTKPPPPGEPKKAGEMFKALGEMPTEPQKRQAETLIEGLIGEMIQLENVARKPNRLTGLLNAQEKISHVLVISRPGTYEEATKEVDVAYEHLPAMFGADRLNSDRAAFIAMQIACKRAGWDDERIKKFDHFAVLGANDDKYEFIRNNKRELDELVKRSDVRLVYAGRPVEAEAIRRSILAGNYIPMDSVDILEPTKIKNTYDQVGAFKEYCEINGDSVRGVLAITDGIQIPRLTRMAQHIGMLSKDIPLLVYPRFTARDGFTDYVRLELKGNVYYAMKGMESIEKAEYKVI